MLDVLFLFPRELEAVEVDQLLAERLVPVFRSSTGLRSLRLSEDTVMSRGGPSPYVRILAASFDSLADWMAVVDALNAMGSPADAEFLTRTAPLVVYFEATEHAAA